MFCIVKHCTVFNYTDYPVFLVSECIGSRIAINTALHKFISAYNVLLLLLICRNIDILTEKF